MAKAKVHVAMGGEAVSQCHTITSKGKALIAALAKRALALMVTEASATMKLSSPTFAKQS